MFAGNIAKMKTRLQSPVHYQLPIGDELVDMNALIGQRLSLTFTGQINCVHCGRKTSKSFNQGYCYPCFTSLAQCDSCIVRPELCHYHLGTCREPEWGEQHCMQEHYVYLANSSGVKVGITRGTQIPTRWMDQGATQAIPIFRVPNRLTSGKVEVIMKNHVADKTSWQKMLKGAAEPVDLVAQRETLLAECATELKALQDDLGAEAIAALPEADEVDIDFPVEHYPAKVKALNFDKTPNVAGVLQGIKGQYLLFDTGVLNVRKFAGYFIELEVV